MADLAEGYAWTEDLGEAAPFGMPSRRTVQREPVGVVGAITPWNFPTQINLAKLAPALAAGCTVVLKPAPDTPGLATMLGRLAAEETDLPAGVLNVVACRATSWAGSWPRTPASTSCRSPVPPPPAGGHGGGVGHAQAGVPRARGESAAVVLDDADVARRPAPAPSS